MTRIDCNERKQVARGIYHPGFRKSITLDPGLLGPGSREILKGTRILPLAHSPADVLAQVMIDNLALGVDPEALPLGSWPIYPAEMPFTPDECMAVADTAGVSYGRDSKVGRRMERFGIQITVRGRDHPIAAQKALAVCRALDADLVKEQVTVDALTSGQPPTNYLVWAFTRSSGPFPLPDNASARVTFVINGTVTLKQL